MKPRDQFIAIIRTGVIVGVAALALIPAILHAGQAASKVHWKAYKSNLLNLIVFVPADWKPVKIPKALAFRYEGIEGGTAGLGILKSDQTGQTIEQAADQEFENEGRPADWVRTNARVDGKRAIKIVGIDPKNTERKIVHYYIETPQGIYLIQCQASVDRWSTFSPLFATALSKLKFL